MGDVLPLGVEVVDDGLGVSPAPGSEYPDLEQSTLLYFFKELVQMGSQGDEHYRFLVGLARD